MMRLIAKRSILAFRAYPAKRRGASVYVKAIGAVCGVLGLVRTVDIDPYQLLYSPDQCDKFILAHEYRHARGQRSG